MEARILRRAGQAVRSEHNYIRAAEPEFLAVWAEEVFEWAMETAEMFLQREVLDRQERGEIVRIYKNHIEEHLRSEAAKNGLALTEDEVSSAIQGASAIKDITWDVKANDTNKRRVDPHKVAKMQKQIETLMQEIDAIDRESQTPGCRNPWLLDDRKERVQKLYRLQCKLRKAGY